MPHGAERSLDGGISVRKRIEGVCEESRVIMTVWDGLCLLILSSVLGDAS